MLNEIERLIEIRNSIEKRINNIIYFGISLISFIFGYYQGYKIKASIDSLKFELLFLFFYVGFILRICYLIVLRRKIKKKKDEMCKWKPLLIDCEPNNQPYPLNIVNVYSLRDRLYYGETTIGNLRLKYENTLTLQKIADRILFEKVLEINNCLNEILKLEIQNRNLRKFCISCKKELNYFLFIQSQRFNSSKLNIQELTDIWNDKDMELQCCSCFSENIFKNVDYSDFLIEKQGFYIMQNLSRIFNELKRGRME